MAQLEYLKRFVFGRFHGELIRILMFLQVQVKHHNLIRFLCTLVYVDILKKTDIIVQMAACTFDAHVLEIFGTLLYNATLIMLHPHGNMDFIYFTKTLQNKQVTFILAVPTFLYHLCEFINDNNLSSLSTIRSLCCGG